APPAEATFDNVQRFDLDGLLGRLNSSSYVPGRDHPRHAAMARCAQEIFAAHAKHGTVAFEYDTRVFYGSMV
ncbi:MAG: SAM-dependent methyltransferase, partial [Betaproteobacteria bacterium]